MDRILAELLDRVGDEANVVVLSDHGFGPYPGHETLTGNHLPNGIFLAAGPDIRSGRIEGLTTVDVPPLLFALLRLPLSRELAGRLEPLALREDFPRQEPPRRVDRYRVSWRAATVAEEVEAGAEEERMEVLKALGYVSGETRLATSEAGTDIPFWEVDPRLRRRAVQGELVYHLLRDDLDAARALLHLIESRDPDWLRSLPQNVAEEVDKIRQKLGPELVRTETMNDFVAAAATLIAARTEGEATGPQASPAR
jgi:hypothetical protein